LNTRARARADAPVPISFIQLPPRSAAHWLTKNGLEITDRASASRTPCNYTSAAARASRSSTWRPARRTEMKRPRQNVRMNESRLSEIVETTTLVRRCTRFMIHARMHPQGRCRDANVDDADIERELCLLSATVHQPFDRPASLVHSISTWVDVNCRRRAR